MARCFWLKVSHEVAVKMSTGASGIWRPDGFTRVGGSAPRAAPSRAWQVGAGSWWEAPVPLSWAVHKLPECPHSMAVAAPRGGDLREQSWKYVDGLSLRSHMPSLKYAAGSPSEPSSCGRAPQGV